MFLKNIIKKVSPYLLSASLSFGIFQPVHALSFGRILPEEIAIYTRDLQTGEVLTAHRADVSVNPASVMKLVTTFAALNHLGENHRWRTVWKSDAPIINGTLMGNLYWIGSGDPVFDQESLQAMQAQLRLNGINRINGQVVFDRSVWDSIGSADGFEADAAETFTTPPDPHLVAYKVAWLQAAIDEYGNPQIITDPPLPDINTDIQVTRQNSSAACSRLSNYVRAQYDKDTLRVRGQIPISCSGKKMFFNMLDTQTFARQSFLGYWLADGGNRVTFAEGRTPINARILAVQDSKPLSQVLADMNKFSNNTIARTVFLTLGQNSNGSTLQNAKITARRTLITAGLDDETLILENGSGLSRRERVSARFIGDMLEKAYHAPFASAFIDSLPIAGYDGTLKNRFKKIGGSLRLKTGTLANVRALAGYWLPENPQQHPLLIVVIINSVGSKAYLPDLDYLVSEVLHRAQNWEEAHTVPQAPKQKHTTPDKD
ncbi:D-alanyl-D-alanine carboxypeptidase/D-alanyl-D-alanine endopeptidase [Stenoxybacter acetivorans]|uniref:D-alanyl-D-alanine carboxypeptidase/D-alanyl-D-alanine endopeptidase n=1 Tax=Stenoxybacter acetivorans TaxID=422441 RepID=UPI0005605CB7|nr:D-alanyl-D-alanine carboxypeptidase/D-alanyl-D-alanine-endopeptidase [Stenoxybacter acetivorans]